MAKIHLELVLNQGKSLFNSLDESAYLDVTSLKITGTFTRYDVELLEKFKNLQVLDLSPAKPELSSNSNVGQWSTELSEMPSLERVIIPNDTYYISDSVFDSCIALKEISGQSHYFDKYGKKGVYFTKDGVLYLNNHNTGVITLIKYPICKEGKHIILDCDQIRDYAFKGAKIETIVCTKHEAPLCGSKAFDGVDISNLTLIVPKGAYYNYKYAKVWKDFLIKEWQVTECEE